MRNCIVEHRRRQNHFLTIFFTKISPKLLFAATVCLNAACTENPSTIESSGQAPNQPAEKSRIETVPDQMIFAPHELNQNTKLGILKNNENLEENADSEKKSKKAKNIANDPKIDTENSTSQATVPIPPKANPNQATPASSSPDWSNILLKAGVGAVAGAAGGSLLDSAMSDPTSAGSSNNSAAIIGGLSGAVIGGILANNSQTTANTVPDSQTSP